MADPQHLSILKRGVDSWNTWRRHTGDSPDLSDAELPGADLGRFNLDGARAPGADLDRADLRLADLRGADLAGANLADCDLTGAVLAEADLYDADLSGTDLSGADLEGACLSEARLLDADLNQARLIGAQLDLADLAAANLRLCDLEDADLRAANLRGARLFAANLAGADLVGARLHSASLRCTLLVDLDLSRAKGLSCAQHHGPSSIGTDTLAKTAAALAAVEGRLVEIETFYRDAGVEQHLVEYYRHRLGVAPGLAPCYIVHYADDRGFASLLHDELQARGVTCWLSPGGHGTPAVQAARARGLKVLLCVSRRALRSLWAREQPAFASDGMFDSVRDVLRIVDLDGELAEGWGGAGADRLRELIVADLSRLESEDTTLEAEISGVIQALAGDGTRHLITGGRGQASASQL